MLEQIISIISVNVKDKIFAAIRVKDADATLDDEYPINTNSPTIWVTTKLSYEELEGIPGVINTTPVYKGEGKPCTCGSGLPRYKLEDARGIFCSYLCKDCEDEVKSKYRPEVLKNANYEADEDIDPEDYIPGGDEY